MKSPTTIIVQSDSSNQLGTMTTNTINEKRERQGMK
jgi:hypothetical protein